MLPEYKRKTNIGIGLGFVVQMLGQVISKNSNHAQAFFGNLLLLLGVALFIWGCAQYSKAKGHSPLLGGLGLLSVIGLFLLFFLTDTTATTKITAVIDSNFFIQTSAA